MYMGDAPTTFSADGALTSVMDKRNSPQLQAVRRLQAGGVATKGCEACFFSITHPADRRPVYFDYDTQGSITARQQANLDLVRHEFETGAVELRSKPLRYLLYFSWFCNLSCVICNQLQSRDHKPDTLPDDLYDRWREDFADALLVDCIGGEPFTIPPAISFLRKFAADTELAEVRLRLTSNGTLIHKHLDWLKAKHRINFNISIDAIGAGYESIRIGGKWEQLRANLLAIRDLRRTERPEWFLGTNALVTKTGIPHLADYARFHVEEGISTFFQVLKLDRGNEEALYREDVLTYPSLLEDVPDWDDCFTEAADIFERGGQTDVTVALRGFRDRLRHAVVEPCRSVDPFVQKLADISGAENIQRLIVGNLGQSGPQAQRIEDLAEFSSPDPDFGLVARLNFQGGVPGGGVIGLRLSWPDHIPDGTRYCQSVVYDLRPFQVLRWKEYKAEGRRIVDMVILSQSAPGQDASLMVSLMSAGAKHRNILPTGLEVWTA